jgi:hypothetical protein
VVAFQPVGASLHTAANGPRHGNGTNDEQGEDQQDERAVLTDALTTPCIVERQASRVPGPLGALPTVLVNTTEAHGVGRGSCGRPIVSGGRPKRRAACRAFRRAGRPLRGALVAVPEGRGRRAATNR